MPPSPFGTNEWFPLTPSRWNDLKGCLGQMGPARAAGAFFGASPDGKPAAGGINYACQHGARLLEAYPKEPQDGRILPADAYTGVAAIFKNAGFLEVVRDVPNRPIMRLRLNDG